MKCCEGGEIRQTAEQRRCGDERDPLFQSILGAIHTTKLGSFLRPLIGCRMFGNNCPTRRASLCLQGRGRRLREQNHPTASHLHDPGVGKGLCAPRPFPSESTTFVAAILDERCGVALKREARANQCSPLTTACDPSIRDHGGRCGEAPHGVMFLGRNLLRRSVGSKLLITTCSTMHLE